MIERGDDRSRDEHAVIAVEAQECQRPKDVEVRLDPPAGQVNQQRAGQHLGGRNDVPSECPSRTDPNQQRIG